MKSEQHPDDPTREPHECRIYGDDMAQTWAVVDEKHYQWAIQWRWHINKPHPSRNGKKQYFVRSLSNGDRYIPKLYLHVEIMKRADIAPPDQFHTIVGHKDDDEWNCKEENLEWVTPRQNRMMSKKSNDAFARYNEKRKTKSNAG